MRLFIDSQSIIDLSYSVNDKYTISIKDITYYVGYHNISTQLGNNTVKYNNGAATRTIKLKDGLYSLNSYFTEIKNIIKQNGDNSSNINYTHNETNGIINGNRWRCSGKTTKRFRYVYACIMEHRFILIYIRTCSVEQGLPNIKVYKVSICRTEASKH